MFPLCLPLSTPVWLIPQLMVGFITGQPQGKTVRGKKRGRRTGRELGGTSMTRR